MNYYNNMKWIEYIAEDHKTHPPTGTTVICSDGFVNIALLYKYPGKWYSKDNMSPYTSFIPYKWYMIPQTSTIGIKLVYIGVTKVLVYGESYEMKSHTSYYDFSTNHPTIVVECNKPNNKQLMDYAANFMNIETYRSSIINEIINE